MSDVHWIPSLTLIAELSRRIQHENASYAPTLTEPLLKLAEQIKNDVYVSEKIA